MRSLWKWAYVAVSLAFMLWLLIAQWNDIRHVDWEIRSALMAAVMVALVMLFFLSALGWHLILRSLGVDTDARTSIRTWLLSSLGRYLPGGVWGYVSRITMGVEQGIPAATVGLALYFKTLDCSTIYRPLTMWRCLCASWATSPNLIRRMFSIFSIGWD